MKTATLLCLTVAAVAPGVALPADTEVSRLPFDDRTVIAERDFGELRFVIGGGRAMKWLEMYSGGNLIGAFRDFAADDVIASPDGKYFLATSNSLFSSYAFTVLDRSGQIVASGQHGGNVQYCRRSSGGIGEWIHVKESQATFSMEKDQLASPAADLLVVTAKGCDGKTLVLAHVTPPELQPRPAAPSLPRNLAGLSPSAVNGSANNGNGVDRGSFFIGNTIQNLRGLDPTFAGRTLVLVDGRRTIRTNYVIRPLNLPATWTGGAVAERRNCPASGTCDVSADLIASGTAGYEQVLATNLVGDFIALPDSRKVFACTGTATNIGSRGPLIVDLEGRNTSLPSHPGPLRVCARTGTGNEVLMVYLMARPGQAYMLAQVLDASGKLLAEKSFEKPGTMAFRVAGKRYTDTVPGP